MGQKGFYQEILYSKYFARQVLFGSVYVATDYTDSTELISLDLSSGTKKGGNKCRPFFTVGNRLELIHSIVFT